MIKILVADTHAGVREGLTAVLDGEPDFQVVDAVATVEHAERAAEQTRPDVALLADGLAGTSTADACARVGRRLDAGRVVVVGRYPWTTTLLSALNAGAQGFVVEDSDPRVLRFAVRSVADDGTFIDPRAAGHLVSLATLEPDGAEGRP